MKIKCKVCGKNAQSGYCFAHKPRKALKKSVKSERSHVFHTSKRGHDMMNKAFQMQVFFQGIWDERPHKSEVSGESLGRIALTLYFHHILPKSKYPDLALKKDNIILLTADEHANVESDITRYEEVNNRRELLIIKYKINE